MHGFFGPSRRAHLNVLELVEIGPGVRIELLSEEQRTLFRDFSRGAFLSPSSLLLLETGFRCSRVDTCDKVNVCIVLLGFSELVSPLYAFLMEFRSIYGYSLGVLWS